jgi:CRISPR-associated protein Csb1
MVWELLDRPGEEPRRFSLAGDAAVGLLRGAVEAARQTGLEWPEEPLVLKPSEELVKLVRLSQLENARKPAEVA